MPQTPYCSESHNLEKTPQDCHSKKSFIRIEDTQMFKDAAASEARKYERHVMKLAIMNGINDLMCDKLKGVLDGVYVENEEVCISMLTLDGTHFMRDIMTVMVKIAMERDELELPMLHHFLEKFNFQEQLKLIKLAMNSGGFEERKLAGEIARVLKSQRRE